MNSCCTSTHSTLPTACLPVLVVGVVLLVGWFQRGGLQRTTVRSLHWLLTTNELNNYKDSNNYNYNNNYSYYNNNKDMDTVFQGRHTNRYHLLTYTTYSDSRTDRQTDRDDKGDLVIYPCCAVAMGQIKADIALHGNPVSELWDITCHMRSHSVTCHQTQVNTPRLTPSIQAGTRDGRLS